MEQEDGGDGLERVEAAGEEGIIPVLTNEFLLLTADVRQFLPPFIPLFHYMRVGLRQI